MGLFGSLFTGVSALGAQSQATAMISNNIANVNTTGFKRSEASFNSLVTSQTRSSRYSPGTVTANRLQRVDQQGSIAQSTSSTDAAISGNGFFAIKRDNLDSGLTEFLYTRNGQFSEDAQGYLRNSAGFYLYGWPLDSQGNLPANQGDLTSLVPIDVAFLGGLTRPTTEAQLAVNLDSREKDVDLTGALSGPLDFQRGLTVYDTLGNAQVLTFEFIKTYGPEATAGSAIGSTSTTSDLTTDLGLSAGDQFTVADELGNSFTYTVVTGTPAAVGDVQTLGDIINAINTDFSPPSIPQTTQSVRAFIGNNGELAIQRTDFVGGTETLSITDVVGNAVTGLGLNGYAYPISSDDLSAAGTYDNGLASDSPPYSNSAGTDNNSFPAFQNLPGDADYNERGWWQVVIRHPDNSVLSRGLVNFNGDGTINSLLDSEGNVDIELNQIDWGNGSEPQNINIDMSRFSQFSSDYTVLYSNQDGAELGLRTGIEIDREGFVVARFSNGASSKLYKLPLVTFANPNGLQEVSGTAYTETEESGEDNLREAGKGGAGYLEASALENSNVDLADEFAKLIVSQRAFSAGTRVITTSTR
ncbi:MAG: flagellar hook-basal body complex protein [Alphaproteobacteria bacterium]|nr:flagellar hook-basal body complex protein [Alphaproteobacteria bacterium]